MIPECGHPFNPETTGMNEKGLAVWEKWEQIYGDALQKLQEERNDPDYTEGWCIIDTYEYVPEIEDEAQLLVWAYGEGVWSYFDDWNQPGSREQFYRDVHGKWFSLHELEKEVAQYFNDYELVTEGE